MLPIVNKDIEDYCKSHSRAESDLLRELVNVTKTQTAAPQMQVGSLEGAFLHLLIQISKAKNILEIGTFTGYSALAMAEALPDDGTIITCDVDPRATQIAQDFWNRSAAGKKISLRLGPALETIQQFSAETFDLVFVDADKNNYPSYWEEGLRLLRSGGLLIIDNALWSGKVLAPSDPRDWSIHAVNQKAKTDSRVDSCLLPIRDGMLLARKK